VQVVVTERACDHTLYNQWQGPRKGSSDDERRRAQGSSQALRKKRATPEGKDDPSAGKVLQSSLAMHPGEDNISYSVYVQYVQEAAQLGKEARVSNVFSTQHRTA